MQALLESYKAIPLKDREVLSQIRAMKKSLKRDWKAWKEVIKEIAKDSTFQRVSPE